MLKGGENMSDTFRKVYAPLTEAQKANVVNLKAKAEELEQVINETEAASQIINGDTKRGFALARTNLEQAIMWAVKATTTAVVESEA